ncbi:response regulator [Planctomycetota bacterium]
MASEVEQGTIRILLVDDHPIVRYGMRQLIELEKDMTVCGEAGSVDEGLAAVEKHNPDLAIVDITMDGRSGIELARDLSSRRPDFPVLMLSIHDEMDYVERALKAGARGYLTKREAPKLIVSAVRAVMQGEMFVPDSMATKLLTKLVVRDRTDSDGDPTTCLSGRELEVFEMMGRGQGTRQIAEALHRSVNTIETHKRHIKQKLDIETASELASLATEWLLRQS